MSEETDEGGPPAETRVEVTLAASSLRRSSELAVVVKEAPSDSGRRLR